MVDTTDYIQKNYSTLIEDIENDIYYDINDLRTNYNRLYTKDRFKYNGKNIIDIIYPIHSYSDSGNLLKGPDSLRFLLSLYPVKEDLNKVQSIIVQPRYIEISDTELISLYIRREKILVLYLHHPHLYPANSIQFNLLSESLRAGIFGLAQKGLQYNDRNEKPYILKIPVLWHILSTISFSFDDKIEKFIIKRDNKAFQDTIRKLGDISLYYSRLGY